MVLPTPLRMHADDRFTGRGVTVAQIDSGFFPHDDLVKPRNRIRAWADAVREPVRSKRFSADEHPAWPGWNSRHHCQWHGLMTTAAAFGNGFLSKGVYRGIATDTDLVLIQTWDKHGHITNETLARALRWIHRHRDDLNIRVVSISVAGDRITPLEGNAVDEAVRDLVEVGVVVVAAAGNKAGEDMVPPATAPEAITVGGLDDRNLLDRTRHRVWHSSYGRDKPEVIAPSLWVAAPLLPGSKVASEARNLFRHLNSAHEGDSARMAELKLLTPDYQHCEGTSFAAPIVASIVACMLQADPSLSPAQVKKILMASAYRVPADEQRQGAGAVDGGRALELTVGRIRESSGPRQNAAD
jgi:serine protease AprX